MLDHSSCTYPMVLPMSETPRNHYDNNVVIPAALTDDPVIVDVERDGSDSSIQISPPMVKD